MSVFSYETQGSSTYLVCKLEPEETVDRLTLGMLQNNSMEGVLPLTFTRMDEERYFRYNVSSKITLEDLFSRPVQKKRLLSVVGSIAGAVVNAENYMIEHSAFLTEKDKIFVDLSTNRAELVCLPLSGAGAAQDLNGFFKTMMFTTRFDTSENGDYIAELINCLNDAAFTLAGLKELTDRLLEASKPKRQTQPPQPAPGPQAYQPRPTPPANPAPFVPSPPPAQPAPPVLPVIPEQHNVQEKKKFGLFGSKHDKEPKPEKAPKPEKTPKQPQQAALEFAFAVPGAAPAPAMPASPARPQPPVQPAQRQPSPVNAPAAPRAVPISTPASPQPQRHIDFGATTVLGDDNDPFGKTVVLTKAQEQKAARPYILREASGEKTYIEKNVTRIGRDRNFVDCYVGGNAAIGRSHAVITIKDGEYFIQDTNSMNHTYLNGAMLQSGADYRLSDGDSVRFANEEFSFHIY